MKKSELREMIKEEMKKMLNENKIYKVSTLSIRAGKGTYTGTLTTIIKPYDFFGEKGSEIIIKDNNNKEILSFTINAKIQ